MVSLLIFFSLRQRRKRKEPGQPRSGHPKSGIKQLHFSSLFLKLFSLTHSLQPKPHRPDKWAG